jgi:hypothetical protein
MSEEDERLDLQWRERFGEPLPICGGGQIVRQILAESDPRMSVAALQPIREPPVATRRPNSSSTAQETA